ncbi:hypothetical protein NE619_14880 [Anaerovorax odorimutans]|uniref:Uncharacterized protein n=1 Tax=Anaerovorax odorimutans TaxID=109327 RepID=A0ABT1RS98_9FIRM|nr:hypothetical protein [Anaerovorax odorimutans]MCQ4638019.1 hypothetical protein [Anaerovorax odorimutans]
MGKEKKKSIDIMGQLGKLSKRELVLIYILVLLVIVAGGVTFLILPASETHSDVSDALMAAEQQKNEVDLMITQKPALQDQVTEYKKGISKLADQFNEIMVNEDIDTLITGMITSSGLRPVSLTIGSTEENGDQQASGGQTTDGTAASTENGTAQNGETGASEESQNRNSQESGTADQQNTDVSSPQTQTIASGNDSVVTTTMVTAKVKGSMGQFSALIGRAAAKKGVAVRSFALTGQEKDETASALAEVLNGDKKTKEYPYTAELVFEVYQSSRK